ncbi:MAG: amidase family protein, partial [Woeseiaceae bacterium]|nr:amidase family protein [Woeseiaceae bacterium]
MSDSDPSILNRRKVLLAALMGGGTAALSACKAEVGIDSDDFWAGFDQRITERTLAETEKVFGLEFSEAERRQILGGPVEDDANGFFADQIETLQSRRSHDIPNSLAPATKFDPRLPGIDYGIQENAVTLFAEEIAPIPNDAESIAFASVKAQARWMTTGQVTSRELTEIYLERIERYGDLLQCYVTVTPDVARAQADQADRERASGQVRGPLHGIPYGVKDLVD